MKRQYFTHGFYLQDLVEFSDKLKMMLAGRYDLFMPSRPSSSVICQGCMSW